MTRVRATLVLFAVIGGAGCISVPAPVVPPAPPPAAVQEAAIDPPPPVKTAGETLAELSEEWFDGVLRLDSLRATAIGDHRFDAQFPILIGKPNRQERQALDDVALAKLQVLDRAALSGQEQLTARLLERQLMEATEARSHTLHLLPLDPWDSAAVQFPRLAAPGGHPFRNVQDYENFLARIAGFELWVEAAIDQLDEGEHRGVTHPGIVVDAILPVLDAQIVSDAASSPFFAPILSFPPEISPEERTRLEAAYRTAILDRIVPAYRKLTTYVRDRYRPKTRTTVGFSGLPDGLAMYAMLLRHQTGANADLPSTHQAALDDVVAVRKEIFEIVKSAGYRGTIDTWLKSRRDRSEGFDDAIQVRDSFVETLARIDRGLANEFDTPPVAPLGVTFMTKAEERSSPFAAYRSMDGRGELRTNGWRPQSRNRTMVLSLSLHEGIPGHHLQISMQQSLTGVPRFRRHSADAAFQEGWALYTESLAGGLGIDETSDERLARLYADLWRAVRAAIDTGIHARGWTMEQAMEYARIQAPAEASRADVLRIIAHPGRAWAWRHGQLQFLALRRKAQEDPSFDPRTFHAAVLASGAIPLDMLEMQLAH